MTAADLRAMLVATHLTHAPGVWDPASAALAVGAGHRAVHLSGPAISATTLGRTDLGFAPATQIADRAAGLMPALGDVPLLADADVGYDSPEDAVWTALAYQRAGISGICLDDGDGSAARIAALAAQVPDLAVIALVRGAGLSDTIDRCRAYAAAGADAVLPVTINEAADLARLRAELPGVVLAVSRSETVSSRGRVSDADLEKSGVRLVLHPLAAVLAALRAASTTYRAIAEDGDAERVDRIPLAAFQTVIDHPTTPSVPRQRPPASRPGADQTTAPQPGPPGSSPRRPGPAATRPRPPARTGTASMPWQIDKIDT
jgi:2-methylisocitrate lyase-like PEP mutase family enzyme